MRLQLPVQMRMLGLLRRRGRQQRMTRSVPLTMAKVRQDNPGWTYGVTSDGALWQHEAHCFIAHTPLEAQQKISARLSSPRRPG